MNFIDDPSALELVNKIKEAITPGTFLYDTYGQEEGARQFLEFMWWMQKEFERGVTAEFMIQQRAAELELEKQEDAEFEQLYREWEEQEAAKLKEAEKQEARPAELKEQAKTI